MKLGNVNGKEAGGEHRDELGQKDAQRQTHAQGQQADDQRLQKEQAGDGPRAHAQQQVGAQLLLPAADHKAVGVENEKGQDYRHKHGDDVDELDNGAGDVVSALEGFHDILGVHGVEHIEDAHAEGEGEEVHRVVPQAALHVLQGQLREHPGRHLPAGSQPG